MDKFVAWCALPDEAGDLLASWMQFPYAEGGETVALAVMRGTEIHFAIAPRHRHRLLQRQRTREFLAPLMERYGFLTTRADPQDPLAGRFLTRLGFLKTWNCGRYDHYMLTALPFERS